MKIFKQQNQTQTKVYIAGKDLPDNATMQGNLLKAFSKIDDSHYNYGMTWYASAYNFAEKLASEYNTTTETIAKLISILSPATDWELNLRNAKDAIFTHYLSGKVFENAHIFTSNVQKAQNLLDGQPVKFAQKTGAFWQNINGNLNIVTVDSIAASIVNGLPFVPGTWAIKGASYEKMATTYIEVANYVGVKPAQLQAMLWVWARDGRKKGDYNGLVENMRPLWGKNVTAHKSTIDKIYGEKF